MNFVCVDQKAVTLCYQRDINSVLRNERYGDRISLLHYSL